jgi:hypothetical protein
VAGGAVIAAPKPSAPPQLVDQGPVYRRECGHGLPVFGGGHRTARIALDDMRLDDRSVRQ